MAAPPWEDAMRVFRMFTTAAALSWLLLLTGCASTQGVRYVYQDKEFGVVGMPENTDQWPTHYRRQADKLMEEHFPAGYEIVRAEEVTEGSRTLKIEGSNTAEIAPQLPAELLRVAKLGFSAHRSQSDNIKIKECRIIYRRADRDRANGFSTDVEVCPARYLDPNSAEHKKNEAASASNLVSKTTATSTSTPAPPAPEPPASAAEKAPVKPQTERPTADTSTPPEAETRSSGKADSDSEKDAEPTTELAEAND
jgi:hypothetical protein